MSLEMKQTANQEMTTASYSICMITYNSSSTDLARYLPSSIYYSSGVVWELEITLPPLPL